MGKVGTVVAGAAVLSLASASWAFAEPLNGSSVYGAARADAGETCQGKAVTIVQAEGIIEGTTGDDVILAGPNIEIVAGEGDDTICVDGPPTRPNRTGATHVKGGPGRDSVQVAGTDNEDYVLLNDIEHMDVTMGWGLDSVSLRWSRLPVELSGTIDDEFSDDFISARIKDRHPVAIDLDRERLSLGPGLSVTVTGFEDAAVDGFHARLRGDDERNRLFLSGCGVSAKGRGGNDTIKIPQLPADEACSGGRLYGQGGRDHLYGGKNDDVLTGGPGRDFAYGGPGEDRCLTEQRFDCER